MRIGILTGGGDVPGLNTVIRDVTYRAAREKDVNVVGIRRGWGGLIYINPEASEEDNSEHLVNLTEDNVRRYDREGGTFLRTSRIQPSKVKNHRALREYRNLEFDGTRDMTEDVIKNLQKLGIDKLIAIGGDDTLSYARHLHRLGIPVIGIPKTMDGDVAGTDYCIGFNTAMTKSNEYVTELRTVLGSHERIGVVEVFGRYSGHTGLHTALASKSDRLVIPEAEFDIHKLAKLLLEDKRKNPSNYSIVVVSEGTKPVGGREIIKKEIQDAYGHLKLGGIGDWIAESIEEITGQETVVENLRYLLRSGSPTAKDKIIASAFANIAMDAVLENKSGLLTAVRNGRYCLVPLEVTSASPTKVDVERHYNPERYRPNYKGLEDSVVML